MSECRIKMYAVYELSKILNASTITELCLDGSSVSVADYTMLLETTKLRYLSLSRCYIQDEACKSIAAKLHFKESAQNLLLINLSSNRITDEGAKHISYALRTNRHLRYLNLADNHITDCGAGQILDVLTEFPLSYDEIVDMRRRRFEYFKRRNEMYEKLLGQYRSGSYDQFSTRKSIAFKRRKTSLTSVKSKATPRREKELIPSHNDEEFRRTKAEMLTAEVLGPFDDPFHPKSIKHKEGHIYSIGNMTLAYFNLAFNNLSYLSLVKLQNVIQYQINYRSTEKGLLKIVIEGNHLPISCPEIVQVEEIITKNILRIARFQRFKDSGELAEELSCNLNKIKFNAD